MGKYAITVEECHITKVMVTAKDQGEAIHLALHGGGTVADEQQMLVRSIHGIAVMPSPGRPAGASKTIAKKATKTATKRKPLSPQARAALAKNLVKARAARAKNRKATAVKAARKRTTA